MRKPRTYEQILKMQMWFVKRKCVPVQLRNAKSLEDLLSVPKIMTEENMKAVDAYERSLLGADFRWPVEGEVYITVRDVFARSQVWLSCAGSSGGEGIIPAGTRITIGMSGVEKPLLIGALPDNPRELEGEFVSEISLNCGQYLNYNLVIGILEFRDGLRLVRPANQGSWLR